jgi:hypothetical protein
MKYFFVALFVVYGISSAAQIPDDIEDTRRKNESFARLPRDIIRSDLATFTLSGIDEAMGKEPLRKISFTDVSDDHITFEAPGIKATIQLAPFDKTKHRLDYDDKYVVRIDRRAYYGDYGYIPKTYIKNITLISNKDTIPIPPAVYSDIYNLHFTYLDQGIRRSRDGIFLSKDGHRIFLYVFCDNSSGSYEVTWIFQDGHYMRRVLDYGIM